MIYYYPVVINDIYRGGWVAGWGEGWILPGSRLYISQREAGEATGGCGAGPPGEGGGHQQQWINILTSFPLASSRGESPLLSASCPQLGCVSYSREVMPRIVNI